MYFEIPGFDLLLMKIARYSVPETTGHVSYHVLVVELVVLFEVLSERLALLQYLVTRITSMSSDNNVKKP